MTATCFGCPAQLSARNRSGLCRACLARRNAENPATRARQKAGIVAHFAKPGVREAYAARIATYGKSEVAREKRRAHGQVMAATLIACNARMTPEQRAANGRKQSATKLAWCPPEWRDRYRELTKRGRRANVARAMVLAEIAAAEASAAQAERDRLAAMTPFERQMERVRQGARLVEVRPIRTRDHDFTLGGVASGML